MDTYNTDLPTLFPEHHAPLPSSLELYGLRPPAPALATGSIPEMPRLRRGAANGAHAVLALDTPNVPAEDLLQHLTDLACLAWDFQRWARVVSTHAHGRCPATRAAVLYVHASVVSTNLLLEDDLNDADVTRVRALNALMRDLRGSIKTDVLVAALADVVAACTDPGRVRRCEEVITRLDPVADPYSDEDYLTDSAAGNRGPCPPRRGHRPARYRSASRAAAQPVPAAVMAWR